MASITLSPSLDGDVHSTGDTFDNFTNTIFGDSHTPNAVRAYASYNLSSLPDSTSITDVVLLWTYAAGTLASAEISIRPYGGSPANRNIYSDTGATRYLQCNQLFYGSVVSSGVAGTTSSLDLGTRGNTDVQACLSGDMFTVAFIGTGIGTSMAFNEHTTYDPPKLTITYTVPNTEKFPTVISLVSSIPAFTQSGGEINNTPTVITLVSSVLSTTAGIDGIIYPTVIILVSSIPTFTLTRTYNPDNIAGKVGVGFITQGSESTVSGDTDATGIKLIVQSGTTLLGFGLNRDGSPWLPGGTSDLGGCISGAAVNMSELTFPRPMKLSRIVVHTKNMNETRGDKFQLALMLDGSNTARPFGAPIKQNGATERYINPGWGYVNRCVLQVSYTNTTPTTKAIPCAITKIELFGKPTGKKLVSA